MEWSLTANTLERLDATFGAELHQRRSSGAPDVPTYGVRQLGIFAGRRVARALFDRGDRVFDRLFSDRAVRASVTSDDRMLALRDLARTVAFRQPDEVDSLPDLPDAFATALAVVRARCGMARAHEIVQWVDDEHWRLDALHAVDRRCVYPRSLIARAVYRGAEVDGEGRTSPALWLTRLVDDRYGLLWRRDTTWVFTEDDREEVLAQIPDQHFEAAASAALA